jgi:hypothetical protein
LYRYARILCARAQAHDESPLLMRVSIGIKAALSPVLMARRFSFDRVRLTTILVVAWITLIAQCGSALAAGPDRVDEYGVRAALLVNFTKFVQWPHDGALAFCVTGDDVFTVAMAGAVGRRATGGREIAVRGLGPTDDFTRCDVAFVGRFVARYTVAILKQVQELPVLTMGESDAFLNEGGDVRVFIADNRIRFQISGSAAEKRGLKISSQLLSLAAR